MHVRVLLLCFVSSFFGSIIYDNFIVPPIPVSSTTIRLSTQETAEVCVQGGRVWAARVDHSCHVADRDIENNPAMVTILDRVDYASTLDGGLVCSDDNWKTQWVARPNGLCLSIDKPQEGSK